MQAVHHPAVRKYDESWVVDCSECQQDGDLPIGIGMRLVSRQTAEQLRENHAGHLAVTAP
jgi:hypothetical protein